MDSEIQGQRAMNAISGSNNLLRYLPSLKAFPAFLLS
jgi:hypothetical protein